MGAFTQSFAQSGNSCSTPLNLGSIRADTTNFEISFPDTSYYLTFQNQGSQMIFSINTDTTGGANSLRLSNVEVRLNNCLTGEIVGNFSLGLNEGNKIRFTLEQIEINTNIYVKIDRYYRSGCNSCDTAFKNLTVEIVTGDSLFSGESFNSLCLPLGNCTNLIENPGFEEHTGYLSSVNTQNWGTTVCGWNSVLNFTDYYHSSSPNTDTDIPSTNTGGIDVSPAVNPWFTGTNEAFAGFSNLGFGGGDVLRGNLNANLTANKKYFFQFSATNTGNPINGGITQVDFSSNINYSPSNYTNLTDADFVFNNIPYLPSGGSCSGNPWKEFQGVFEASGNETSIFIGNLKQDPNVFVTQACTTTVSNTIAYILVDNLALVPLVDAGSDFSGCPDDEIQLNEFACAIPGATYTWSPSTGLSNANIINPVLTIGTISNYTLTVSITINGTTYTETDDINITINGVNAALFAQPLLAVGGTSTLTAPVGAAGTTYQFQYYDGTSWVNIGSLQTSNTLNLTGVTQTTDYKVIITSGNCVSEATVTVYYGVTCANVSGNDYWPNNGNSNTHTFSSSPFIVVQAPSGSNTGFAINSQVDLTGKIIFMESGAQLKIDNSGLLKLTSCQLTNCTSMWNRINNQGILKMISCTVEQGDNAIFMRNNSGLAVYDSYFLNNVISIVTEDLASATPPVYNNFQSFEIIGNTFTRNNAGFAAAYSGQPTFYARPAAGMYLHDIDFQIIGDANAAQNNFTSLYAGIVSVGGNIEVNNSKFDDMLLTQPSGSTGVYTRTGIAVSSSTTTQEDGSVIVRPINNQDWITNPTINNCRTGIQVIGSSLTNTYDVFMQGVRYGVRSQSNSNIIDIQESKINATEIGIELKFNTSSTAIDVNNNDIIVTNNANGACIAIVDIAANTSTINVTNNLLICRQALWGVRLDGTSNVRVTDNLIAQSDYGLSNAISRNFIGISLVNSQNNVILNDSITGSYLTTTSGNTSNLSIYSTLSPNNYFGCNRTSRTSVGMYVIGDCNPTNIEVNEFNQHRWGLFLSPSALIGANNTDRGNSFNGPFGNWGVRNDNCLCTYNSNPPATNGDAFQLALNRITIHNVAYNTQFHPTYPGYDTNPLGNWIFVDVLGGPPLLNCNPPAAIQMQESAGVNNMENFAKTNTVSSDFNAEMKWSIDNNLYKIIDKQQQYLDSSTVLTDFYNSLKFTNHAKVEEVNNRLNKHELISSIYWSSLTAMNNEKIAILSSLSQAFHQQANQTVKQSLMEELIGNSASKQLLKTQYSALKSSHKMMGQLLNNSLSPGSVIESNIKEVNTIILNKVLGQAEPDLSSYATTIFQIANQCPLVGGKGVYTARVLYGLINNETVYNDSICDEIAAERRGQASELVFHSNENNLNENNIMLFPNPAQNTIKLVVKENLKIKELEIVNSVGVLIPNLITFSNNNQTEINIESYADGYYVVKAVLFSGEVFYKSFIKSSK